MSKSLSKTCEKVKKEKEEEKDLETPVQQDIQKEKENTTFASAPSLPHSFSRFGPCATV
jgi:hypothetical protein